MTCQLRSFTRRKSPGDVLDYTMDWTPWLQGVAMASSAWTVSSPGVTVVSETNTDFTATVILSGGTADTDYTVKNTITVGPFTVSRDFILEVR